jgi:hypothetical protein
MRIRPSIVSGLSHAKDSYEKVKLQRIGSTRKAYCDEKFEAKILAGM